MLFSILFSLQQSLFSSNIYSRDHLATILNVTIPSLFDKTPVSLVLSVPLYKGDDVRTKERSGSVKKSSAHTAHSTSARSHTPALSTPESSLPRSTYRQS